LAEIRSEQLIGPMRISKARRILSNGQEPAKVASGPLRRPFPATSANSACKRRAAGEAAEDAATLDLIGNAATDREECGEPRNCAGMSTGPTRKFVTVADAHDHKPESVVRNAQRSTEDCKCRNQSRPVRRSASDRGTNILRPGRPGPRARWASRSLRNVWAS